MTDEVTNAQHLIVPPSKYDAPYYVTENVQSRRRFDIYFNKSITSPCYYSELCQLIRSCGIEDVVHLYLNTMGGSVDAGVQIINAIRDCQGKVVTILDGTVCSMGSLIFLSGHEFVVHNTGRLMFHNYSGGVFGKGHEQIAHLQSTVNWVSTLITEICYPFLTSDEILSVVEGKDYWLDSDQVRTRLDALHEYEEEQMIAMEKEQLALEAEKNKPAAKVKPKSTPKPPTKKPRTPKV